MKNTYRIVGDIVVIDIKRRNGDRHEAHISLIDLPRVLKEVSSMCITSPDAGTRKVPKKYVQVTGNPGYRHIQCKNLHNYLMCCPHGKVVDHINEDPFDNTRGNLRIVTSGENLTNRSHPDRRNKSGMIGVHWDKKTKKWRVRLYINGKRRCFGAYTDREEANQVAREARAKYYPCSREARAKLVDDATPIAYAGQEMPCAFC